MNNTNIINDTTITITVVDMVDKQVQQTAKVENSETKISDSIVKTKKFSAKKWGIIEKPLSPADVLRNKIICDLGEKNASTYKMSSNLITIGEYNYLKLREEITKDISLPKLVKTETKKQKINKKTQIILDNCQNTLKNKIEILLNILKSNPQEKIYEDLIMNFNFVEFRLVILMKIIENYTEIKSANSIRNKIPLKFSQSETKKSTPEKEEVLIAGKKILHLLKKVNSSESDFNDYFNKIFSVEGIEIKLSEQLIMDLEYKISMLAQECGIKLYDVAIKHPKFIFDTKYDITIPQMSLKPYDSQIELMSTVKNNLSNGFVIMYKTLPGLGKTTMILGICKYIKKSDLNVKVIFCCSDILESVRVQVLRTMYNFQIKFGVGTATSSSYKITNSWNCSKDEDRELIVADYVSTYKILKEKKHEYLLFFDEPTVHTDKKCYETTLEYLSKILYYMPKYTILSSATLPQVSELKLVIDNYKNNYPEGLIHEIISNKTLTGCVIKDFNNKVITPHTNCTNISQLKELIKKIKQFPLLGKFYTLPFLMNLNEFMKQFNKNIDLESIESFDQENILENILLLVERVCSLSESDFELFKRIEIQDIIEEQFDKTRLDVNYDKVLPEKLLTSHSYKYIGCCLVAVDEPMGWVKKNFYPLVEKLKQKVQITNINTLYEKYKRDTKKFQEQIDSINEKFTQDSKIDEEIEKIMHLKPEFKFPNVLEINTRAHIETFAKYVKTYETSLLKTPITHEQIDITDYDIDEELKFLLYMGVGLYCKNLDPDYCNLVLEMLSERQLAFVIADESFCYGANYQISNVIITDELANTHSINTILQLIGRTSRVGKSWSGKVYLDNNTCNRISKFFLEPKYNCSEGENISEAFVNVIELVKQENEVVKQKVMEEKLKLELVEKEKLELKKKEELAKILAEENKKKMIDQEKLNWREARQMPRTTPVVKVEDVKNYRIQKPSTNDSDWSSVRKSREPIVNIPAKNYRVGISVQEAKSEVKPEVKLEVKPEVKPEVKQNNNFRQQKEDEFFNILYKKKK